MGVPSPAARLADFPALRSRILEAAPVDPPPPEVAGEALAARSDASFASLALAAPRRRPLVQPRGGFARFADQRRLTLALAEAGADFVPLTIDSHTRHNDYRTAQVLLERSEMEDQNLLNGYPLVNHGYRASRQLYQGVESPVSLRHGTPDARLLIETALATGITEIEGGPLSYTIPYSRGYPLARAIAHWQYCDRLAAELSTAERPVHRESFGVLTATMVPPCVVAAIELCELLLAAEQGVRSFSLSFGQTGSLLQDLALARVLREAARDVLARFGFAEARTYLVYHQWMGAFPYDYERATALIAASAQIAALVGADKVITKTKEEARGIPAVESNCEAVRLVRYTLERAAPNDLAASPAVAAEAARIRAETDAILDAVFAQPQQAFWASVAHACVSGVIDVPFAPHEANANLLVTRRGRDDGIYIVEPGRTPIPPALLEEERALAAERSSAGAGNRTFQAIMRDINLMAA
jgi:methylaspartate mutase epsilon subunit